MNYFLMVVLFVSIGSVEASQGDVKKMASDNGDNGKELSPVVRIFVQALEPTFDKCRPAIRVTGPTEKEIGELDRYFTDTFHGNFACLVAGFKDVMTEFQQLNDDMCILVAMHDNTNYLKVGKPHQIYFIGTKKFKDPDPFTIVFTPAGKLNAYAWAKWIALQDHTNFYLVGYILGYPEQDMKKFYKRFNAKMKEKGLQQENFKRDKVEALRWILDNQATVEQWMNEHAKEFDIKQGKFKDVCSSYIYKGIDTPI